VFVKCFGVVGGRASLGLCLIAWGNLAAFVYWPYPIVPVNAHRRSPEAVPTRRSWLGRIRSLWGAVRMLICRHVNLITVPFCTPWQCFHLIYKVPIFAQLC
jgi:hypothetical protein